MEKLRIILAVLLLSAFSISFSSCEGDPGPGTNDPSNSSTNGGGVDNGGGVNINTDLIIGEWKANKIEATLSNGTILTYTDEEDIKSELKYALDHITITQSTITSMNTYYSSYPAAYTISNNTINAPLLYQIIGTSTLGIYSTTENEVIIKFIDPNGRYTSLITYNRVN